MRPHFLYYLTVLFFIAACQTRNSNIAVEPNWIYAKEPVDSSRFTHVKDDFYQSPSGELFERKIVMARPRDSACHCRFIVVYDSLISVTGGDNRVERPLKEVIDIASFSRLDSTFYSRDNQHVFYFYANSDGGSRSFVKGADPATFRRLGDYRWGVDKKHVFYEAKMLKELDVSKVQVLYSMDTSDTFVKYVKDDQYVFADGEIVPGADARTFRMIADSSGRAEDKKQKY